MLKDVINNDSISLGQPGKTRKCGRCEKTEKALISWPTRGNYRPWPWFRDFKVQRRIKSFLFYVSFAWLAKIIFFSFPITNKIQANWLAPARAEWITNLERSRLTDEWLEVLKTPFPHNDRLSFLSFIIVLEDPYGHYKGKRFFLSEHFCTQF